MALAATLALGGCGGVEFKGKLFDYAGLTGDGTQKDIKMAQRAPLVLPPDTNTLPPPGAPAYTARADWPTDTDAQRKQVAAAKEAEEQKDKAAADPNDPWAGKPRLLDLVKGKFKKGSDEEEVVDVPEPDPADKTPEDKAREQRALAAAGGPKPLTPQVIEPQAPPAEEDPFHPAAPDSYKQMSGQAGN